MECPKCHHKIGKFDLGQNCKYCGVNLMYYNLEESLAEDAKLTELSFAKTRIFAAKVKAAFIGGPLQIIRLVMLFGCVGLLMVPFATLNVSTALYSQKFTFNALECYNALSAGTLDKLGTMSGSAVVGSVAPKVQLLYYVILALAVICILQLVFVIISMAKPRAFSGVVAAMSVIGIGGSIFSIVAMSQISAAAKAVGELASYKGGFGAYAAALGFAVMLALNLIMCIKGIEIKYKPGDLYRVEVSQKLKAGKIKISELPLPVFETEEEKAQRLAEFEEQRKAAGVTGDDKQKEVATNG